MRLKFSIRREIRIAAALIALTVLIAFSERHDNDLVVNDVTIAMDNIHDNHFLDEQDVQDLLGFDIESLKGASLEKIQMKNMEDRLHANPFVRDAQLYCDLKGHMVVNVVLHRPVARLLSGTTGGAYVAEDGSVMPISRQYSSRVLLIGGSRVPVYLQMKNLYDSADGMQLMGLVDMINADDFWRAQVAEVSISSAGDIELYPQVGGQVIEFGDEDNLDVKFRKLRIFYKEILPRMGWNKYKRVSLQFEGQIVAE